MMIDDCYAEILRALEDAHGSAAELPGGVLRFSVNPHQTTEPPLGASGEALDHSDCWVEVSISEAVIWVLGQNYHLAAFMIVCPNTGLNFFPPQGHDYSGPTYVQLGELDPATVRNALKVFQ